MDCRHIQRMIWTGEAADDVAVHVTSCPDCRSELVRATDIRTGLSGLRAVTLEPPAHLHEALIADLERPWGRRARDVVTAHPRFWRGVGVGAAAAAATAVGLLVARRKLRPELAA